MTIPPVICTVHYAQKPSSNERRNCSIKFYDPASVSNLTGETQPTLARSLFQNNITTSRKNRRDEPSSVSSVVTRLIFQNAEIPVDGCWRRRRKWGGMKGGQPRAEKERESSQEREGAARWPFSRGRRCFVISDTPIIRQPESVFRGILVVRRLSAFHSHAFLRLAFIGRFDGTRSLPIAGISLHDPSHESAKLLFKTNKDVPRCASSSF